MVLWVECGCAALGSLGLPYWVPKSISSNTPYSRFRYWGQKTCSNRPPTTPSIFVGPLPPSVPPLHSYFCWPPTPPCNLDPTFSSPARLARPPPQLLHPPLQPGRPSWAAPTAAPPQQPSPGAASLFPGSPTPALRLPGGRPSLGLRIPGEHTSSVLLPGAPPHRWSWWRWSPGGQLWVARPGASVHPPSPTRPPLALLVRARKKKLTEDDSQVPHVIVGTYNGFE